MKHLFISLLFSTLYLHAQIPFSQDSALSYLKTISVKIGARPMGSPNEQKALEFAVEKFREFGLDDAYIMKMYYAENDFTNSLINTNSGVALGILRGKTNKIILIGGHIDSASPFVQGTNDNGSGSAVVIELARVLSKEKHNSTLVFCLFGGEESGLCGSNYFVKNFPQIDSVALMLQIDMANGSEILIPSIDSPKGNSPIWLVYAAYEEMAKLKYSTIFYPTHFFTAMSIMPGGGVSSDHEPFLRRGIPAIAFTSDLNDPIHTPQDDFKHFKPSGLKRSGDLIYSLVNRFDENIPEEKNSNYYLLQIGKRAIIFPLWILTAFINASLIIAIFTLFAVRKRRIEIDNRNRPKVPALKLFLVALIIQTFVWLSENIIGLIKGVRYPWVAYPDGYFVLAFFAALLGIALSLKLASHINLSRDPYRWFLRTFIFLIIFIGLLLLANVKIALYPAIAICLLSLAMLVRKPWLKFVLWILSPHFMLRLIFSEGFLFISRMTALHSTQQTWMYVIVHIFYILFFAVWSFPFLLGFAAIYFDSKVDLLWLKKWRTKTGLILIITAFVLCTIILFFIPSYSDEWRNNINIEQTIDLKDGKGEIKLKSSEYLKNVYVRLPEKDTLISTWDRELVLKEFIFTQEPWIKVERMKEVVKDSNTTFSMLVKIHFKYRPYKFNLYYSSGKNKLEEVSSEYISSLSEHSATMQWEAFPDTSLMIPIRFKVVGADSVKETIEANFIELAEPIKIEKELTNILPQTIMKQSEVIKAVD